MIVVSSLAAGGPVASDRLRVETDADQPVSHYGESKKAAEARALAFREQVPVVIVRPPLVYGPRDRATFLFVKTVRGKWVPQFASRAPDGQKHYSAIHVEDLCRGLVLAAATPLSRIQSGDIYYLSADGSFTFATMMRSIGQALGVEPKFVGVPFWILKIAAVVLDLMGRITGKTYPLNRDKLAEIAPDYWTCSNDKAKRVFGFKPKYTIEAGWKQTVAWYKENGWLK